MTNIHPHLQPHQDFPCPIRERIPETPWLIGSPLDFTFPFFPPNHEEIPSSFLLDFPSSTCKCDLPAQAQSYCLCQALTQHGRPRGGEETSSSTLTPPCGKVTFAPSQPWPRFCPPPAERGRKRRSRVVRSSSPPASPLSATAFAARRSPLPEAAEWATLVPKPAAGSRHIAEAASSRSKE